MGQGEEIKNKAIEGGKNYIKQAGKKMMLALLANPFFYIVTFVFFIIIIVIGYNMDVSGSSSSSGGSSSGMSSVEGSGTGSSGTTGAVTEVNVYNDDGTVNEEKIQELQLILETNYNLVPGSLAGNNIGGEYNKESCEKVTGTYLGFSYWDGSIPRSKLGGIVYQCPWWANGRASEVNKKEIKISGNAKDMYANAQSTYNVGSTPKQNSLVVYDHGEYGHVAYIEAVDEVNGCYYISHAGSGQSWFGIQKISSFTGAPWDGYTLIGFVYVGEPKDSTV